MRSAFRNGKHRLSRRGLTLIEAMLLLVVTSIIAVAAGVGLQAVVKTPAYTNDMMTARNVLVNVTEQTKANLLRGWPTTTFTNSVLVGSTSYSASIPVYDTSHNYGAPPSYTVVTNTLAINDKTYQLSMAIDLADPAGGSSYKPDYCRVTVAITPYVYGTLQTSGQQTMVTYVTNP